MKIVCWNYTGGQVDPPDGVERALPFELTNPDDTSGDRVDVVEHNPPGGFVTCKRKGKCPPLVVSENYQSVVSLG